MDKSAKDKSKHFHSMDLKYKRDGHQNDRNYGKSTCCCINQQTG